MSDGDTVQKRITNAFFLRLYILILVSRGGLFQVFKLF